MATNFIDTALQKIKSTALSLGKKVVEATPFADPASNGGRNFWGGFGGEVMANYQQGFNMLNQAPRIELPKPQVNNQIAQTGINLLYGIPESIVNIPRNVVVGGSRVGTELGETIRDKRNINLQNLAGGIAPMAEGYFDALTMGLTKPAGSIAKTALQQYTKDGLKSTIIKGALKGGAMGGAGGLTYGLDTQYGKKFNTGEVLTNVAAGTVLGGLLGGGLAGAGWKKGNIKELTTYSKETREQLRDAGGRWVAGEVPVKPRGMTKNQWRVQLEINQKLGRNPYEMVSQFDFEEALKSDLKPKNRSGIINFGEDISPTQATKGIQPEAPKLKQTGLKPTSQMKTEVEQPQLRTKPMTLEQTANQAQSTVKEAKPLTDIINSEPIDVKSKVGILDYLRTPDRVLQKIGLGNEAVELRKGYEKYLAELPQEINKVTEWSKQVTPEGNTRIFKFLDGQEVQLNPTEQRIAKEIKTYLKDWADRLNLPEDKRISNYITHIFEKDFIKKEFDPEFAKLIENRIAGSTYDPFTEQRLGKMGYIEDTWRALDAYVKRATRKVNMDPALAMIKDKGSSLESSQWKYIKSYIDRVNMRPTDLDDLVDNSIKQVMGYKFGARPTAVITRAGRQAVYRGALGLNVGSALRNLTQGANTYAKLGEKYTIKGYMDLLTKGVDEPTKVGVLADDLIQDRTLSAGKQIAQTVDKVLFYFFESAEKINRGSAYWGAKAKALSEGMDEQQAIDYAKSIVRDTQFTFGRVDTPVAMQSDIVKLITQFQTYSLKQAEFLGEMVSKKDFAGLLRYGLANMAIIFSVGKLIGMKPQDMIPSFRIGLPPTLATPVEIGKAVIGSPDKYGNVPDTQERIENVGKSLTPYVPGGVQIINKTIPGLMDVDRGYSQTAKGNVRYPIEQSVGNYLRGGLFGPYQLPEAQEYRKNKSSPLSENQTALFKESQDRPGTYKQIMDKREANKAEEKAKEEVKLSGQVSNVNGKIFYLQDGETKSINVGEVESMPSSTAYEKALKDEAAYALADDILVNLPIDKQTEAFDQLGISIDDAVYYNVARQENRIKSLYITDEISRITSVSKDRGELVNYLVSQRKEISGKMVLANGIVDDLFDAGIISKSEQTMLKNLKIVDGKPVTKLSGRGKSTTLKKVSLPSITKLKAPNMKALLAKTTKLKVKKYRFRRTL